MPLNTDVSFEVTAEWIRRHQTPAGGWTRAALAVLGVGWPPPAGWIQTSVGKLLSQRQRAIFEAEGRRRRPRQERLW